MAAADFDRDGNVDLAVTLTRGLGLVQLLLGDGKGGFSLASGGLSTPSGPLYITSGDFNRDGRPDLATADGRDSNDVSVWLNRPGVAPGFTSVTPSAGPTGGGNAVTIAGSAFELGSSVKFGDTASGSVTVQSATKLTAVAPAHTAGVVDVTVTTPGGTSTVSAADRYTYGSYTDTVLGTSGLLGYWRLGETSGTTAKDALGAHNGTYTGGYTLGAPGALVGDPDTAVSLEGTSGTVLTPSLGTAGNWTIEGWTNLAKRATAVPYGNNALYARSPGVRLIIRPAGFYVDDGSNRWRDGNMQASTPSNINRWVYWALVRSGSTLALYRNGVQIAHSTLTDPRASKLNGTVGSEQGVKYFLQGTIDEPAIYNTALTPQTITLHYNLAGHSGP